MWRPEKWEETTFHLGFDTPYECGGKFLRVFGDGVEAGADAILEALLDEGSIIVAHSDTITLPGFLTDLDDHVRSKGNGKWVFIPEEE